MLGWQQVEPIPASSEIRRQLDASKKDEVPERVFWSEMAQTGCGSLPATKWWPRGDQWSFFLGLGLFHAWVRWALAMQAGYAAVCIGSLGSKCDVRKRRQLHHAHYPFSPIKWQKSIELFLHITLPCKNLLYVNQGCYVNSTEWKRKVVNKSRNGQSP